MPLHDEPDKRYRVLVLLQRSDRPRYFTFHCMRCQMPVADLANSEVVALNDVIDFHNTTNQMVSVRCDGRYQGGHCRTFYLFSLSDNTPKPRPIVPPSIQVVVRSK